MGGIHPASKNKRSGFGSKGGKDEPGRGKGKNLSKKAEKFSGRAWRKKVTGRLCEARLSFLANRQLGRVEEIQLEKMGREYATSTT